MYKNITYKLLVNLIHRKIYLLQYIFSVIAKYLIFEKYILLIMFIN